jgi:hypothetical protein
MRARSFPFFAIASVIAACSGAESDKGSAFVDDSGSTPTEETSVVDDTGGSVTMDDGGLSTETLPPMDAPPTGGCIKADDCDGDGYTKPADCNDNDPTVNPDAYDFPGDMIDNDCSGAPDDAVTACAPALTGTDATSMARAMELCAQKTVTKTGKPFDPLVSASWGTVSGAGSKLTITILGAVPTSAGTVTLAHNDAAAKLFDSFGSNAARAGGAMPLLSTGTIGTKDPRGPAINTSDRWFTNGKDKLWVDDGCAALGLDATDCSALTGGTPSGSKIAVTDLTMLTVKIQVPSNAKAMSFDFAFFSTEFNEFWKTAFNDAFFAVVKSKLIAGKNVAKDTKGQGITVNSGFFQLCPNPAPKMIQKPEALVNCVGSAGDATKGVFGNLAGTYYDGAGIGSTDNTVASFNPGGKKYVYGGGSGWLTTKFGVEPGEVLEIKFFVVDAGDGILDSAVLLDNIQWEKAPPKTITGEVDRPPR